MINYIVFVKLSNLKSVELWRFDINVKIIYKNDNFLIFKVQDQTSLTYSKKIILIFTKSFFRIISVQL